MDIAKLLNIKTAVIRDNDGKYQENCVERYSDYNRNNIKVFADSDNARNTFEVCIYQDNTLLCEELFSAGRKTLTVEEFMLANKAEAAYILLDKKGSIVVSPQYIAEALAWIKE